MDSTDIQHPDHEDNGRAPSLASTASATLILTPASSETSGIHPGVAQDPMPTAVPAGALWTTTLSATSWRPQYPTIGQFDMTEDEEVVAAGPDGLIYFMRIQDHPSKPWSDPRPFPRTAARLNASTVTGLAIDREDGWNGKLHVYCVADGALHAFSCSKDPGSSLVVDPLPPFTGSSISGTPAIDSIEGRNYRFWWVVVPCRSGGIFYTSIRAARSSRYGAQEQVWESAKQVSAHIGIVSAVSLVITQTRKRPSSGQFTMETTTRIVVACIASARLHSIEWSLKDTSVYGEKSWKSPKSIRVHIPGEVTGNPVLLKNQATDCSLDLLVPSVEGGIFHFIRPPTSPDEWHMIGRIKFPSGFPLASSLTCARLGNESYPGRPQFRAHVQCGGRLYLIEATGGVNPWAGSQLHPIEGPGPFLY